MAFGLAVAGGMCGLVVAGAGVSALAARRVCVIGSGAAGLAAARRLQEAGLEPTVLERGGALGGLWALGEAAAGGAVYPGLVTNLPKELMAFHDVPFDGDLPSFVRAADVARYLQAYARLHRLERAVRLRCTVTEVRPCAPPSADCRLGVARWCVRWRDERGDEPVACEETFDAVVVANGHYEQAAIPPLGGVRAFVRAGGTAMHARRYKRPEQFAGKRVVIVGARASGTDIAREVAAVAASVVVADPACAALERVGGAAHGTIWRAPALARLDVGEHGPCAVFQPRPAAVATAATAAAAQGATSGDGGRLQPGAQTELHARSVPCDAVIACTGYAYAFPFLGDEATAALGGLLAARGVVAPLRLRLFHAVAPSLAFIGLPHSVVPFPLMDAQAALVARVLAADARATGALAPAGSRQQHARELLSAARRGEGEREPLHLGDAQWEYVRELARLGGFYDRALDARLRLSEAMYKDVQRSRPAQPGADDAYRRARYELLPSADAPERARVRRLDGRVDDCDAPSARASVELEREMGP
ncbi:hypothetical protein KFE25_010598 [Diacronema lutheri]|uniref:Flavin-containing monooxygenase n=2 Tax=Diacronema lutheri TaxID=2081491 RepID=A0A8J5X5E0_DIALT|nr:hypothetical protein KFE25_010598 [Diacronema lutheri]